MGCGLPLSRLDGWYILPRTLTYVFFLRPLNIFPQTVFMFLIHWSLSHKLDGFCPGNLENFGPWNMTWILPNSITLGKRAQEPAVTRSPPASRRCWVRGHLPSSLGAVSPSVPPGFPYAKGWHDLCTLWAGGPQSAALLVTKPPPPDGWPQVSPRWVPPLCHPAVQSKAEDHCLASSLLGHTPFSLKCLGETHLLFDVHSYIWYFLIWCLCPP